MAHNLNPEQHAAVTYPAKPLLVLAGAGSGKTRVLTSRVVHLVQEGGVDPRNILAVTFTNKAAREMEERVVAALDLPDRKAWPLIVTFHSLGLRILRAHHEEAGLPERFAIYDQADQKALARRVLSDTQQRLPANTTPDSLCNFVSSMKSLRKDPAQAAQAAPSFRARKLAALYKEYQESLRGAGAVDFEDLLYQPLQIFARRPHVLEKIRQRFHAVLVDEYQDTNENQYRLVRSVAEEHRNITVVGDDDQSIYGWRGADSRNISRFLSDFSETTKVALEVNYRSTALILEAANAVLSTIEGRHEKTLRPAGDQGELLRVFEAEDEVAEAGRVVKDMKARAAERHLPWNSFGILYRTNKQSEIFQNILAEQNVPFRVVGGQKLYERKEVKDAVAFLRVLAAPRDELALRRVWNTPARGLGAKAQQLLLEGRDQRGLLVAMERAEELGLSSRATTGATHFAGVVNRARRTLNTGAPFPEVLRDLLQELRYDTELTKLYPDAGTLEGKRERIEWLFERMTEFHEGGGTLPAYLDRLALLDERDRTKEEGSGGEVTLMTIHAAKGLEFPHVYLVGMEEGLFPSARSIDFAVSAAEKAAVLNEERRLFYVAITRAQRGLTISYCQRRTKGHETHSCTPSTFLEAIPAHLIERLAPEGAIEVRMERGKTKIADILANLRSG